MPLKHLRVCESKHDNGAVCGKVRFAPCSVSCGVPNDEDPNSWRENLQEGAGTMQPPAGVFL